MDSPDSAIELVKDAKLTLLDLDWERTLQLARSHPSLLQVSNKSIVNEWCGVWDEALNFGTKGTKLSQSLFKTLCKPLFGNKLCKICSTPISEYTYIDHICSSHNFQLTDIIQSIRGTKSELFTNPTLSCNNYN